MGRSGLGAASPPPDSGVKVASNSDRSTPGPNLSAMVIWGSPGSDGRHLARPQGLDSLAYIIVGHNIDLPRPQSIQLQGPQQAQWALVPGR